MGRRAAARWLYEGPPHHNVRAPEPRGTPCKRMRGADATAAEPPTLARLRALRDGVGRLRPPEMVTAVRAVARIPRTVAPSECFGLLEAVARRLQTDAAAREALDGPALSSVLRALAHRAVLSRACFRCLADRLADPGVWCTLTAPAVGSLGWTLGHTGLHHAGLLRRLVRWPLTGPAVDAVMVTHLLWALARLGVCEEAFLAALLARIAALAPTLTARQLALCTWSVARLGLRCGALVRHLESELPRCVGRLSAAALADLVWGYADLSRRGAVVANPEAVAALAARLCRPDGGAGGADPPPDRMVPRILWGFAVLAAAVGGGLADGVLALLQERALRCMREAAGGGAGAADAVRHVLEALPLLPGWGASEPGLRLLDATLLRAALHADDIVRHWSPHETVDVLRALATLLVAAAVPGDPPVPFPAADGPPEGPPRSLTALVCLGAIGVRLAAPAVLGVLRPAELSAVLSAYARVRVLPSALVPAVAAVLEGWGAAALDVPDLVAITEGVLVLGSPEGACLPGLVAERIAADPAVCARLGLAELTALWWLLGTHDTVAVAPVEALATRACGLAASATPEAVVRLLCACAQCPPRGHAPLVSALTAAARSAAVADPALANDVAWALGRLAA